MQCDYSVASTKVNTKGDVHIDFRTRPRFLRHLTKTRQGHRPIESSRKRGCRWLRSNGISLQTMREFSSYHSDKIAARKAELQGELNAETAHLWVSDKAAILAYYQMMLDRLKPKLDDPDLDDRSRSRFDRDAKALLHDCSELNGDLPTRTRVELEASGGLPAFGVIAQDAQGNWYGVDDGSRSG
jgi:nucleotide-binding universal stress UspA family protein